ncbi:ribonuclease H-like domain-containing protein [Tanacetum coccineum]
MTTLKFADTHNMVAFLSKPTESDGFEQIVDFLNAHSIRHALTINPTIYISCIEQFWSTVKAKTINGEAQLHALVDGKKIIITESTVRRDLQLEDAEGVDCLPNSTIFEQLTLMGYEKISQKLTFYKPFFSPQWKFLIHTILQCLSSKTTAWNEFSSTMTSAIICLATNQKFNFSKYIFESMIRNLDNLSGKFLMYPRFVQVFLDQQLDGLPNHKRIYIAPSHTKKIFGNMRRVGKGFSGRVTPLFPTMVVQNQSELGEGSANPTDPHHTPTIIQSSCLFACFLSQEEPKKVIHVLKDPSWIEVMQAIGTKWVFKNKKDERGIVIRNKARLVAQGYTQEDCQETMGDTTARTRFESVSKHFNDSLLARGNTLQSDKDRLKLEELMALCTSLQNIVLDLEKTMTSQHNEIVSLKRRVKKLEKKRSSRTHKLKRLYKVGLTARVESSGDDEDLGEDTSKQGRRINTIDADEDIILVIVQDDADNEMFDVNVLNGEEVFVAGQNENIVEEVVDAAQVNTAVITVTITTEYITLAQDKGKGIMIEEPIKPMKKKDQISFDEEVALKLQAEFNKEERFTREKAEKEKEANIALIEE